MAARPSRTLIRLGPTFVKFGQMVSTRVDLYSEPVLAEPAKLRASLSPFDTAVARVMPEEAADGSVRVVIQLKKSVGYRTSQDGTEVSLEFSRP